MAKQKVPAAVIPLKTRPGEGPLIDVQFEQQMGPNGFPLMKMGLNLGFAPVPDRRYVADCASVVVRNGAATVLLGQEKIVGGELRSLLVISLNRDALSLLSASIASLSGPTIKQMMAAGGTATEALWSIQREPDQTVALAANMVAISFSSQEACLDFYQASAASLALVPQRRKLALDPVVRVEMRLGLADALLDELARVQSSFGSA